MMKKLLVAAILLALPALAYARKTADNSGHIVHNRRAGVIMHRAVPPFHGVHVYEGGRRMSNESFAHPNYGFSGADVYEGDLRTPEESFAYPTYDFYGDGNIQGGRRAGR
jgi:hypothetical protein